MKARITSSGTPLWASLKASAAPREESLGSADEDDSGEVTAFVWDCPTAGSNKNPKKKKDKVAIKNILFIARIWSI
jgi:hypothetical protein